MVEKIASDIQGSVDLVHMQVLEQLNQAFNALYCMLLLNDNRNVNAKEYVRLVRCEAKEGLNIELLSGNPQGNHIHQLSGGQRALLGLALVFAILKMNQKHVGSSNTALHDKSKRLLERTDDNHNPIYILDECDAALDEHNQKLVSTAIKKLFNNNTQVLCVSHHTEFQKLASSVIAVQMHADGYSRITVSK